jgi:3-oxoacyl-[acyl-carrier protein] reductase
MAQHAPLAGRAALVTGVSRARGIGVAIVRRLLADGAAVLATGWPAHDAEMPWGAEAHGLAADPARLAYEPADLADPETPEALVAAAQRRFGRIDIVIANHARSAAQPIDALTAEELDRCFAVNTRASALLAKHLAAARAPGPGGRLVLFTSGQGRGPMPGELPYAISKGAIEAMTPSLADALADRGITVNCVNPGPVDTGWATGALHAEIARRFPAQRWGTPEDVARLVAWLASDEAGWITGQLIHSEGGFRRA